MKPLLAFICFILSGFCVDAQNLVPNYSFENTIKCATNCTDFIGYVTDWTGEQEGNGLFYYTSQCRGDTGSGSCAYCLSGSVPYNFYLGFQYAHSGVSYAGICNFVIGNPSDTTYPYGNTIYANTRNYLEAPLTNSLQTGVKYYVDFFVNLQNSSDFVCSDMGAYFSDSALVFDNPTSGTPMAKVKSYLIPQVANDPKKQELGDTLNWMKISGSFIAKGGEKYIVLGNFKNDSLSSIRYIDYSGSSGGAYYYIDDVIVSPDSNYADSIESVNQLTINNAQLKIWPKPSQGIFNCELKITNYESEKAEIEVYNMFGEKVYSGQFSTVNSQFSIDLSDEQQGIYLYRVVSDKGENIVSGKLVVQ